MNPLITCPCGPIRGTECRPGVLAFKGIRYAAAGRWEYPTPVTAWDGVYDAAAYGACSFQPRSFYDEEFNEKKYFYYNEFRKGESYVYAEDCLFLNIWTPASAGAESRLPVLVYIHGGGFTGGCGHEKHFDGPRWPEQGVVAVTINYRLGPMGFLCLPQLKEEAGHTGNYGLYDQLAALQWVQRNIAAFGGDPGNVTVMGQSAGAMSVQHLCQSPLTDGLFHRAVMSSGGGAGAMFSARPEKAFGFWQEVMKRCGCESLAEFRSLSPETLFAVWTEARRQVRGGAMAAAPVTDCCFIPEHPQPKAIPYMLGANSEDMMPPILHAMARKWCRRQGGYVWHFDRRLPGDDHGAWHSSDLWYWFGTLDNAWRPWEDKDRGLSAQMISYLCNFCRSGDPNGPELPVWAPCPEAGKAVLRLGEGAIRMEAVPAGRLIRTMLTNKAVGE